MIVQGDALAAARDDRPVPMYHNIIDPNVAAVDGRWVPTDVDVTEVVGADAGAVVAIRLHRSGIVTRACSRHA